MSPTTPMSSTKNAIELEYEKIPLELRERPQWVCYKIEIREDKPTKIPINWNGGSRAKSDDPATWGTFEQCASVAKRYEGIGFIVSASDPYVGIDLDHCVIENPETGIKELESWARLIVNQFDSYAEYSRSGSGVHIIIKGKKPGRRCRVSEHPNIEIYEDRRFLVMTGCLVPGNSGIIQPAANEISALYFDMFGNAETGSDDPEKPRKLSTNKRLNVADKPLTDDEVIDKAKAAKNGPQFTQLWNGDLSNNNNDASAADQALCNFLAFWTDCNQPQMDRLFRQSGLMREKWERDDYREQTLQRAIQDCGHTYKSRQIYNSNSVGSKLNTGQFLSDIKYLTDLGNAEFLIDQHGENLRYDVDSGQWLHWSGMQWKRDDTGEIERLACMSIRSMYDTLPSIQDPDKSKALFSHVKRSESRRGLEAMIALGRHLPGVPVKTVALDADHWALNCVNGTVDLRTGKLKPHQQRDLISKIAPVIYDPEAECPRWIQFLKEVFQEDEEIIDFVHRMVGYCLTGDTREESVFILYGRGQCGKSKFMDVLRYIFGDYIRDTPVTTFVERTDNNTADLASLSGARLVTASEAEENQAFNEPLLKRVAGRDPITCRHLYKSFFTYVPTFKIVFATNDVPKIRSQSFAMKRRIKLIPFRQRFYDPDEGKTPVKDDKIYDKLIAEASGILAWAVKGCLEWKSEGLRMPKVLKREIEALFDSQDPIGEFLDMECVLHWQAICEISSLWQEYLTWCDTNKQHPAFKAVQWFAKNLAQRDGIDRSRGTDGIRLLRGITTKKAASDAILQETGNLFRSIESEEDLENSENCAICVTKTLDLDGKEGVNDANDRIKDSDVKSSMKDTSQIVSAKTPNSVICVIPDKTDELSKFEALEITVEETENSVIYGVSQNTNYDDFDTNEQ